MSLVVNGHTKINGLSRRQVLLLLGLAGCSVLPAGVAAADTSPQVYFAGHAFLSRHADIPADFPHLHRLLGDNRGLALDELLSTTGRQGSGERALRVEFLELGRLGPGLDANVLALAFDREIVVTSPIGATWKLLVELSFQALVFDFRTGLIRASFPITLQYLDAFDQQPGDAEIRKILERMVFGSQEGGVTARFWSTLGAATLPEPGARTLRVSQVGVAAGAEMLSQAVNAQGATNLRDQLGYDFGTFLSGNQKLSVLPYAPSQAVEGKMAARMANGSVFNLTVPEADHEISLQLDGLKKVQTAVTPAGAAWVYGAFVTVHVAEPLSGRVFFQSQIKLGATRTIPATARQDESDWPSYAEVIRQLFDEFTRSLSGPDERWGKSHLVTAGARLQPLKELIESCR